jgi:hypothetical protein
VTYSQVHEIYDVQSGGVDIPVVEYQYVVNGTTYSSAEVSLRPLSIFLSRISAASQVGRYPVGRSVTVHYDPVDPANAAIEVGLSWADIIFLVAFLGFGPALAAIGNARLRRNKAPEPPRPLRPGVPES